MGDPSAASITCQFCTRAHSPSLACGTPVSVAACAKPTISTTRKHSEHQRRLQLRCQIIMIRSVSMVIRILLPAFMATSVSCSAERLMESAPDKTRASGQFLQVPAICFTLVETACRGLSLRFSCAFPRLAAPGFPWLLHTFSACGPMRPPLRPSRGIGQRLEAACTSKGKLSADL